MATKKTAEAVNEETIDQEEPTAKKAPKDEWDEEIEMLVPRKPKGDDPQYYVCVNDRRYMIPANGKMQKLPRPIAEVLQESLAAEAEADDYADSLPNRDGSTPQQHAI